ncbi:MAG: rhombosortase [Desulforhopalus sp.]
MAGGALPACHLKTNTFLYIMTTTISSKWTRNLPIFTLTLAIFSLVISSTSLRHTLQYDRVAVAGGQLWLLLTGHFSHWSPDNLLWDLLVFVVLGVMTERRSRSGLILCLGGSATLISGLLWFVLQDMDCYRGLSGLDSALFSFTALWMVRERIHTRDYREAGLILLVSATFLFKIVYESYTQESVFTSSVDLFTPVPLAHLAGGFVGIIVALFSFNTKTIKNNKLLQKT